MVDDWLLGKDPPDWVLFYKPQVILAYIYCTHLVPILVNLLLLSYICYMQCLTHADRQRVKCRTWLQQI